MRKSFNGIAIFLIGISFLSLFFLESFQTKQTNPFFRMENEIVEEEGLNQEDQEEINFEEIEEVIQTSGSLTEEPKINSKAAIVWERNTKQVLFEKNADKKVPMASTTKIMTAIIVLENAKLTDVVTVEKKAAQTGRIATRIKNKRQNYCTRLVIWLDVKIRK